MGRHLLVGVLPADGLLSKLRSATVELLDNGSKLLRHMDMKRRGLGMAIAQTVEGFCVLGAMETDRVDLTASICY